jgi:chorismate synthase
MNTWGHWFRVTTFGESHGPSLGAVVDGVPAGLPLTEEDIQPALDRRRPGQSRLVTPRGETDRVRIEAGVFQGLTTGAPVCLQVVNHDADPSKYENVKDTFRPSHADWTWEQKFGHRDWRGGGRTSARETVARVAAGAIADKLLHTLWGVEVLAWVDAVGEEAPAVVDPETLTREAVEATPVRCPDPEAAGRFQTRIETVRREKDSVGGVVAAVIRGVPAGWGEPTFGRLEAELARGMLSLPASKGFEVGSGFAGTRLRGSQHNDAFEVRDGRVRTVTNRSGGVQGGISNGESIVFRVAFKPVATIFQPQQTVDRDGRPVTLEMKGRHDPCVLPRAVPLVEAMAWLVLADAALAQAARAELQAHLRRRAAEGGSGA